MRVDLFVTPQEIPLNFTKDRRVVVVDVLRTSTNLAYALHCGVEQIIPVESVESAKLLQATLDPESSLLAGEQDGEKLPGFDLGNSPSEFQTPEVAGKTILYWSNAGAPLLSRQQESLEKLLLAFVNMRAVVDYLRAKADPELTIVCAGQNGRFSMEDTVCGGMLIDQLGADGSEAELNDAARAAWILYLAHRKEIANVIRDSSQGVFLRERGMESDLEAAARVDTIPIVPAAQDGRIRNVAQLDG